MMTGKCEFMDLLCSIHVLTFGCLFSMRFQWQPYSFYSKKSKDKDIAHMLFKTFGKNKAMQQKWSCHKWPFFTELPFLQDTLKP